MSFAQGRVGANAIPNILGPYLTIQDASSLAQTSRRRAIDEILQTKVQSILAMLDSVPINTPDYSDFDSRTRIGVHEDSTVTLRKYIYYFTLNQSFSWFGRDHEQVADGGRERYSLLFLILKMLYRNKIVNISLDQYPEPFDPGRVSKLDLAINIIINDEDIGPPMPEYMKTVRLVLKLAAGIMPDSTASQRIREDIDREEEEEEMGGAGAGGGAGSGAGAGGARRGGSSSGGGSKRPRSESFLEGGKTFFTFY
jgi:uncharacterized membrane protein YgcG